MGQMKYLGITGKVREFQNQKLVDILNFLNPIYLYYLVDISNDEIDWKMELIKENQFDSTHHTQCLYIEWGKRSI